MSAPEREPTIERERRLHEILGAFFEAVEAGRAPEPQDLIAQHPDLAEDLAAYFADEGRFQRLVGPLHSTAASGARGESQEETVGFSQDPNPPGKDPDVTADPSSDGHDPDPALAKGSRIRYFGDYELKLILGRGGMGVVYKAKQLSLNRLVALKMIRAGLWAGDDEVRRFQTEAEAVANLDHPRIVTIHEVGQYEGHHYFSMRLVEGPSLEKVLDQYAADPRRAARLVSEVARAVHHAHQRGILHRDLKPSNILLDGEGHPHVTDFGLAKRLEGNGALSISGTIAGTPSYMSPEQASGSRQAITTATDVYGLGALLYAALTGRPPFQSDSVLETLDQVRERLPESPSTVNRRVPRDLEVICLKCLEKDPKRRYGSADALADDLERYVRGEPILARRTSMPERVVKWARRRPAIAALLGLVVLTAAFGFAGVLWQWRQTERARAAEERANGELARTNTVLTEANETLRRDSYFQRIALAQGELRAHNVGRAEELLAESPEDLRGWEWRYLKRVRVQEPLVLRRHDGMIFKLAFSPDGRRLASACWHDHTAKLWDTMTGEELLTLRAPVAVPVNSVACSPDGRLVATATNDHAARLWDVATGRLVRVLNGRLGRAELTSAERVERQTLADQALAALGRAIAHETNPSRYMPYLEASPSFDVLRSRPDFRLLMWDLTFPAWPFSGDPP
jgi:hypothetical protein